VSRWVWVRVLLGALACALVVVGLQGSPSDARGLKRVDHVTRVTQDWYNAKLKIRWRAVKGATYKWRYALSPSDLSAARVRWTGTWRGTYTQPLDRSRTYFVQVRAYKKGAVGPWSRTRQFRFVNRWPSAPTMAAHGVAGGVQFTWGLNPNTSRYRVRWSPAWYGAWPGAATYTTAGGAWLGQSARSSTFKVPTTPQPGDGMVAVAYGNPVFGRLEANNQYHPSNPTMLSRWVVAWPKAPTPATGDPIRFGTYNVMLNPTGARAASVAKNISSHGLTMVALQEAKDDTSTAVRNALGSAWSVVGTTSNTQQILYRNDKFTLQGSGVFEVDNWRDTRAPIVTPYARFAPKYPVSADSQSFWVVSAHFTEDASKSAMGKNADTGRNAREVMAEMDKRDYADEPIIVAGDLRYGREPWGDVAGYVPAQPTFVRGGYYDAEASQAKLGQAYSTVNSVNGTPTASQKPNAAGLGPRADYILLKGITGSKTYSNVYNWSNSGSVPSDHNLVYSDIMVPPGS
jgi:hypothetical protein